MIHKYCVNGILLFLFLPFAFSSAIFRSSRTRRWIIRDTKTRCRQKMNINFECILLRGGSEESNEPSAKSGLWNSISNVFQMNLNAKDELGNDDIDRIIHLDKRQLLSSLGGGDALMQLDDKTNLLDATNGDVTVSDELLTHEPLTSDNEEMYRDSEAFSANLSDEDINVIKNGNAHNGIQVDGSYVEMTNENIQSDDLAALPESKDDQKKDDLSIKESIDEIVREEWNMVPDTEVEDEGNEFGEATGISARKSKYYMSEPKKAKMNTSKTKLNEDEDITESFRDDSNVEPKDDNIMNLDDTVTDSSESPSPEVSVDSSANAFVSSGLVSF